MKKIIVLFLSLFLLSFANDTQTRIRSGILTDDFGIVTEEDLRHNAQRAYPENSETGEPNLVWQCLPLQNATLYCDDISYNDEENRYECFLNVRVAVGEMLYEFSPGHIVDYDDFVEMEQEIHSILDGEEVACFSAFYNKEEDPQSPFQHSTLWFLERIKSRKGEWSYSRN